MCKEKTELGIKASQNTEFGKHRAYVLGDSGSASNAFRSPPVTAAIGLLKLSEEMLI